MSLGFWCRPVRSAVLPALVVAALASPAVAGSSPSQSVSLTLYPQGLAVVRLVLEQPLAAGRHSIRIDDLPRGLDLSSLLVLDPDVTLHRVHGLRGWDEDLAAGVSVRLELECSAAVDQLGLIYLTSGLGWSASYSVMVAADDSSARIDGYATLDNTSAVSFRDAEVQLLAGDVNLATGRGGGAMMMERSVAMAEPAPAPAMDAEAFGDYHLYAVGEPVTLAARDVHRLRLLGAESLTARKEYLLVTNLAGRSRRGDPQEQAITVRYRIVRPAGSEFGDAAVPGGVVRIFQPDDDGRVQLLGSTRIGNTAAERDLVLPIGRAFDLTATRTQADFSRLGEESWEAEWVVALRNVGSRDREVLIQERIRGDWELVDSSHPGERRNAGQLQFRVAVAAGEAAELRFRLRVRDE